MDNLEETASELEGLSISAGMRAAPLGVSFKKAITILYSTGRYALFAIVTMTLLRGVLPAVQVAAISSLVSNIADLNTGFSQSSIWALAQLSFSLVGAYALDNLLKYAGDKLTLKLSYKTDIDVVRKLRSLEVQDFESSRTYDAIQRVDSNTGEHIFSLFDAARSAVQAVISICGIVSVIAAWNLWIALVLLVAPIPAAIATFQLQTKAYDIEFARAPKSRLAGYFRALLTSDSTRKEIKVFRLAELFEDKYTKLRSSFLQQDALLIRFNLTKAGSLGLISVCANVGSIVFAAILASNDGRVGELAGFISASSQMNGLVLAAFLGLTGIYQHLLYVSNWVAVMEMEPSPILEGTREFSDETLSIAESRGIEIEFRDVSFIYPGTEQVVLNGVSFKVDAGSTTAIVGLNGSGKTTICKLLLRFYEPSSGVIFINGIDIAQYSRESIYSCFSALFQDFAKFERSLGDNVAFGSGKEFDPLIDYEDVEHSLRMVSLDHLGDILPEGLSTVLGRRFAGGRQLSIGQWQRLATARALYKKPALLVLDEPTASVDAVSEKAMFEALDEIDYNLTILLVAHRFTTICHAEKIIVLDNGRVVGNGDHKTLLTSCQFYSEMFHAQRGYA